MFHKTLKRLGQLIGKLFFDAHLSKQLYKALLILVVTALLGLFILSLAAQLFISKNPTTEFLVNSTWCSIPVREVIWMFDEDESFARQTLFFDGYSREKVFESGSWRLVTTQNENIKIQITWHETQSREAVEQYFNVTTNGANLLRVHGDLYGFGEEGNTIFYRCNDPR